MTDPEKKLFERKRETRRNSPSPNSKKPVCNKEGAIKN